MDEIFGLAKTLSPTFISKNFVTVGRHVDNTGRQRRAFTSINIPVRHPKTPPWHPPGKERHENTDLVPQSARNQPFQWMFRNLCRSVIESRSKTAMVTRILSKISSAHRCSLYSRCRYTTSTTITRMKYRVSSARTICLRGIPTDEYRFCGPKSGASSYTSIRQSSTTTIEIPTIASWLNGRGKC